MRTYKAEYSEIPEISNDSGSETNSDFSCDSLDSTDLRGYPLKTQTELKNARTLTVKIKKKSEVKKKLLSISAGGKGYRRNEEYLKVRFEFTKMIKHTLRISTQSLGDDPAGFVKAAISQFFVEHGKFF